MNAMEKVPLHLELCIKDLHVQSMFENLLLTHALGLGFVTFFVFQGLDLVVLGQTLNHLGLEVRVGCIVRAVVALRTHATNSTTLSPRDTIGVDHIRPAVSTLQGKHHQPFVVFFSVVFFVPPSIFPRDICMLHSPEVGTSIGLDNHQIANVDMKTGAFLNIENVRSAAFEVDDEEWLAGRFEKGGDT